MGAIFRAIVQGIFKLIKRVASLVRAILYMLREACADDIVHLVRHARLFIGLTLTTVGLLSFHSDRYCDGNASSYYACTRPATFYYYPPWATALVVVGVVLIVLWFLRSRRAAS